MLFYAAALQTLNYDWDTLTQAVKNSRKRREALSPAAAIRAGTGGRPVLVSWRGRMGVSWVLMRRKD